MSGKNTTVVGIYPTRARADAAVETLRGKGFRDTDVSVLVPQNVGPRRTLEPSGAGGPSKMPALLALGQSVWLDHLSRDHTRSGRLQALIDAGLRGLTSNPTIFAKAIAGSPSYDAELAALIASSTSDQDVLEALMVTDVREAADLFRDLYDATSGTDGFVSLEVSPDVARDTTGSITRGTPTLGGGRARQRHGQDPWHTRGMASNRIAVCMKASTSTSRCCFLRSTTWRSPTRTCERSKRVFATASRSTP